MRKINVEGVSFALLAAVLAFSTTGCLLIAGLGAGAEAGYVVSQEDRTAEETLQDQYLVTSIKTKLIANQEVSGLDINVDSHKAVVTLRGALRTQREINTALDLAKTTPGVRSVESKLVIVQ